MVVSLKQRVGIHPNVNSHFDIIKSDGLHIAGYASIEMVDKQNDLITLDAMTDAVKKFMTEPKYRNVMTNHSNVQVGEVVKEHRDSSGRLWKTAVDDVGFFVVIKLREDIEKAKEVSRSIRNGNLRSFSIGGQAIHKKQRNHEELGDYNEISKLELHEVTICEKGINPEAKFDILKQDNGNMGIENALNELNSLLKEIKDDKIIKTNLPDNFETMTNKKPVTMSDIDEEMRRITDNQVYWDESQKVVEYAGGNKEEFKNMVENAGKELKMEKQEGENVTEEYLDTEETSDLEPVNTEEPPTGDLELTDFDDEEIEQKEDLAYGAENPDEAGEVIHDGTPRSSHPQIKVSAGENNAVAVKAYSGDTPSLDLSSENLEKAYAQFKAEQMEKMAYEDIKNSFESRLETELNVKKDIQSRDSYDAQAEVNELKKQFGDLLSSLKGEKETIIRKQQQVIAGVPSYADISNMDWNEIHATLDKLTGGV